MAGFGQWYEGWSKGMDGSMTLDQLRDGMDRAMAESSEPPGGPGGPPSEGPQDKELGKE